MELSQYFTGLVVLICAIHLASMVGRSVMPFSTANSLENKERPSRQRCDWFLFFHCSALTGAGTKNTKKAAPSSKVPLQESATRPGSRPPRASVRC
jgi:hypothetical protein